jgi:ABC-type Fe3+/spermidine/putrescine transport system ATPase subunit
VSGVAYLRLRNVVKSYDGRSNAVNGISIDIERGECVTLLGPSGSGKTTTLMMIAWTGSKWQAVGKGAKKIAFTVTGIPVSGGSIPFL